MNQEPTSTFMTDSSPSKKKHIFAVHSFLQPMTLNEKKRKKKIPTNPNRKNHINLSHHPKFPIDTNEIICDTTSDDSQNEKSPIKDKNISIIATECLIDKEYPEGKCNNNNNNNDNNDNNNNNNNQSSPTTSHAFNFRVPSFFNDTARVSSTEENFCRYSDVLKKYLYLEERDLYLINSERSNMNGGNSLNGGGIHTSAKFDEDLFFNFDN